MAIFGAVLILYLLLAAPISWAPQTDNASGAGWQWEWQYDLRLAYALEILPELIDATLITIRIALLGYLVSLGVGLLLALARLSRNRWLSTSVWAISEGSG